MLLVVVTPDLRIHHAASSDGSRSSVHAWRIRVRPAFAWVHVTSQGWSRIASRKSRSTRRCRRRGPRRCRPGGARTGRRLPRATSRCGRRRRGPTRPDPRSSRAQDALEREGSDDLDQVTPALGLGVQVGQIWMRRGRSVTRSACRGQGRDVEARATPYPAERIKARPGRAIRDVRASRESGYSRPWTLTAYP